jgi:hypothetical protein
LNENWYRQLAQQRQRELLEEAKQSRLLKEAGIRDSMPGALEARALVLLALPFAVVLARALVKL